MPGTFCCLFVRLYVDGYGGVGWMDWKKLVDVRAIYTNNTFMVAIHARGVVTGLET